MNNFFIYGLTVVFLCSSCNQQKNTKIDFLYSKLSVDNNSGKGLFINEKKNGYFIQTDRDNRIFEISFYQDDVLKFYNHIYDGIIVDSVTYIKGVGSKQYIKDFYSFRNWIGLSNLILSQRNTEKYSPIEIFQYACSHCHNQVPKLNQEFSIYISEFRKIDKFYSSIDSSFSFYDTSNNAGLSKHQVFYLLFEDEIDILEKLFE